MGDGTLFQLSQTLVAGNSKAKKRKISEILPSVEGEQVGDLQWHIMFVVVIT